MTIASQLTTLNTTKTNIKAAIEAKGVTVGAVPFADYPSKIAEISGGGTPIPSIDPWTQTYYDSVYSDALAKVAAKAWVRPTDWLAMPTVLATDEKFVGLLPVYNFDSNKIALVALGNYTVDWGDGVIENFNSNTTAEHTYTYSSISESTLSTKGYKQVLITVTPQSGQTLSEIRLNVIPAGLNSNYKPRWLDVVMAFNGGGNIVLGSALKSLERFRWIGTNTKASFSSFFSNCTNLQSVEVYTGDATNLDSMFSGCCSLVTIPQLNTSNVTNMNSFLYLCQSLITIPELDTSKVTDMSNMFGFCYNLITIPLLSMNQVTTNSSMFRDCTSLRTVPLFNTSSWTSFSYFFTGCFNLERVPLFNTSNVNNMGGMFSNCRSLKTIPQFDTSKVNNMGSMFNGCHSLITIPELNTPLLNNINAMFQDCYSLLEIPLFSTTLVSNISTTFNGCRNLTNFPLFDFQNVTTADSAFRNCFALQSVPNFNFIKATSMSFTFASCSSLKSVSLTNTNVCTSMSYMFDNCSSLETVTFSNTSALTNMTSMFSNCRALNSVSIASTAAVTNMNSLFSNCISLTEITFTNTSNVTDMASMFNGCTSLVSVSIPDTGKVTTMSSMFSNCKALSTVPSVLGSPTCNSLSYMFNECNSFTGNIRLITNATGMGQTFYNCFNINYVEFDLYHTTTMSFSQTFYQCYNIKKIKFNRINNGVMAPAATQAFFVCTSLNEIEGLQFSANDTTNTNNTFVSCFNLSKCPINQMRGSVSFSGCALGPTELVEIFNSLGTGTGKTITITGNWGAALLTTEQRAIATNKGWTITG